MNGLSMVSISNNLNDDVDLDTLCQEIRERAVTGEFDEQAYVSLDIIDKLKKLVSIAHWFLLVLVEKNVLRENFVN